MDKLFCDLKAGKNICKICNEDAYYPPRNPRKRTVVKAGEDLLCYAALSLRSWHVPGLLREDV